MLKLNSFVFTIASFGVALHLLQAENIDLAKDDILDALSNTFPAMLSKESQLQYKAFVESYIVPHSENEEEAVSRIPQRWQVEEYEGAYSPGQFYYHCKIDNADGPLMNMVYAFDGNRYQIFDKQGGTLFLNSKGIDRIPPMYDKYYLFAPFIFVTGSFDAPVDRKLTLQDFTSSEKWKAVANIVEKQGEVNEVVTDGQRYLVTSFPGGVDVPSRGAFNYKVYFSTTFPFLPMRWEKIGEKGQVWARYTVMEYSKLGGGFPYPSKAIYEICNSDGVAGQRFEISIKDVKYGSACDPDYFTIDPATATAIRDVDSRVRIEVPR